MKCRNSVFIVLTFVFSFFGFSSTLVQVPQWARSVDAGSDDSFFRSLSVDSSGNVYVSGNMEGPGIFDFGNNVTVTGVFWVGTALLVKYNSSGNAEWAKSVTGGLSGSVFGSVAVDLGGDIYAVGYIGGGDTYNFGNGVTVAGTSPSNAVLVKYDGSGNAQWARSVIAGSASSDFNSVAVDSSGNIYASGGIGGASTCDFGNGVTVFGTCSSYDNVLLVKYDSSGIAQWAKSVAAGPSASLFRSTAVDLSGNVYAAGIIRGTGTYDF